MAVICKKCGLPDDLCPCGIDPKLTNMQNIVKELKSQFACGGTAKDGFIMLQGDHRDDVKGYLVKKGFNQEAIEVQ